MTKSNCTVTKSNCTMTKSNCTMTESKRDQEMHLVGQVTTCTSRPPSPADLVRKLAYGPQSLSAPAACPSGTTCTALAWARSESTLLQPPPAPPPVSASPCGHWLVTKATCGTRRRSSFPLGLETGWVWEVKWWVGGWMCRSHLLCWYGD